MGAAAEPARVLVVEDDVVDRKRICGLLGPLFNVVTAKDGQTALAMVERLHIDCALLDQRLPDLNGTEVLRRMRDSERAPPVIMLTGDTLLPTAVTSMRYGAVNYLTKDRLSAEALQAAVKAAVKQGELRRALEAEQEEMRLFAQNAAHDLQGPLRRISQLAELVESKLGRQLDQESLGLLRMQTQEADRLRLLVADLLAFARAGQRASTTRVSLAEVFDDVARQLATVIEQHGARVEAGGLHCVTANRSSVWRLLLNLVTNALVHGRDDDPVVHVHSEIIGSDLVLHVEDNGDGVDEAHRDGIFRPFVRHSATARPGTGLGLAICARVALAHHGSISVGTSELGGAAFRVRLPGALP